MEADATFERPTWTKGARVSAKDTIDVTFVLKTCPMKRAKLEAKVPSAPSFGTLRRMILILLLHLHFDCGLLFNNEGAMRVRCLYFPPYRVTPLFWLLLLHFSILRFMTCITCFCVLCPCLVLGRLRPFRPRVQEVPFSRRPRQLAASPSHRRGAGQGGSGFGRVRDVVAGVAAELARGIPRHHQDS